MKTPEQIKINKRIAEFMGFKMIVENYHGINIIEDPTKKTYDLHQLRYDSSWDWLMPVVEKIESLPTFENWLGFTLIKKSVSLELIYDNVVSFIEWYNSDNAKNYFAKTEYCPNVELMPISQDTKPIWSEIRDNYEDEGVLYIDGWLSDEDNGSTIAIIKLDTKEVIYYDERAKHDKNAQEVINNNLKELK